MKNSMFVAQEEMSRNRGYWWSPDTQTLLVQQTDDAGVEVRHVADPLHPEVTPTRFFYPRAGTPNAVVRLLLVPREGGKGRIAGTEIMLNSPLIADLIFKGEVTKIKEVMARSTRIGMKTFDQSLFDLYELGFISYEEALRNADSKNELRLRVKLESKRNSTVANDSGGLELMDEKDTLNGRSL